MRSDSSQLDIGKGKLAGKGRLFCGGPAVATGLGCSTASDFYRITSPAAPALSIAEQLEPLGWTNDAGSFSSMALGLSVLCPMCAASARQVSSAVPTLRGEGE
jgi:hypothetical protein